MQLHRLSYSAEDTDFSKAATDTIQGNSNQCVYSGVRVIVYHVSKLEVERIQRLSHFVKKCIPTLVGVARVDLYISNGCGMVVTWCPK